MNIQLKYLGIIVLISMAFGAALTRKFATKEVTKTQIVDHDVIKDHIVTVTKEIVLKDGTKEFDTTVTDDRKNTDVRQTTITDVKPILSPKHDYFASVSAGLNVTSLRNIATPVYGLSVDRYLLGPIYGGVWLNTQSQVGVELGVEF